MVPAIGFAAGLERLLIASELDQAPPGLDALVAPIGREATSGALVLGRELRAAGMRCEVDTRGASLKAMLRRASGLGARACIIVGERELASGTVEVKDLAGHSQQQVARAELVSHVRSLLSVSTGEGGNA